MTDESNYESDEFNREDFDEAENASGVPQGSEEDMGDSDRDGRGGGSDVSGGGSDGDDGDKSSDGSGGGSDGDDGDKGSDGGGEGSDGDHRGGGGSSDEDDTGGGGGDGDEVSGGDGDGDGDDQLNENDTGGGGDSDGGDDKEGNNVKEAMKDLFGDDDDDDDDEEEEEDKGQGGEDAGDRGGGSGGGGGGGRYGTAGGGASSDDEDENIFDDRGRIRGGNEAASSPTGGGEGFRGTVTGSDDEEGDGEEEAPPPALPDRELQIPALPRPPLGAEVFISRLPNILGIKTEAFSPETYDEEAEAAEFKFTTNIIRWRYKRDNLGRLEIGEDGLPLRQSNSRLVKWSDGSTQLLVGDEAFDVGENSIDRSALYVQQMTHEGSVLQCQGELTKKITFKPSNVLSKAHRTLTLAVRKRAVKGSRIQKYAETIDPEKVKQERARAQEAENKQTRRRNREYAKHPGDWRSGRSSTMNIGYLEAGAASGTYDDTSTRAIKSDSRAGRYDDMLMDEDDEEEDEDEDDEVAQMAQLRARRAAGSGGRKGDFGSSDYSEGEDGEGRETAGAAQRLKGKKRADNGTRQGQGSAHDSEEDGEGEGEEEEEGEDEEGLVGSKRPQADYDEEDGYRNGTGSPERKKQNRIEDSDSD